MTGDSGTEIEPRPVAGHIGAEITGVDLAGELDDAAVAAIRSAVLRWKVVFFRDQELDHAAHIALARRFGEPVILGKRGSASPQDHPEVETTADRLELGGRYGMDHDEWLRRRRHSLLKGWHCDHGARVDPPAATILRAETVPPYRGHPVVQPGGRLRRALGAATGLRRRAARRAPAGRRLPGAARRRRLSSASPRPSGGDGAPARTGASRDGRTGAVRERLLPRADHGPLARRERTRPATAPGAGHASRVHGPLPLGTGQRRLLGQPGHHPPRPRGSGHPRASPDHAPRDARRRRTGGPDGKPSAPITGTEPGRW